MELTWQHPALLFTLALVPLLALAFFGLHRAGISARQTAFLTERPWRFLQIAILAMVLLILAAAGPVIHFNPPTDKLVVLVDCSAAARSAPWHTPRELRQLLLRYFSPKTRVTLVTFARHAHLVKRSIQIDNVQGWPLRWPATQHICGRLASALAWRGSATGGPGRDVPRWLLTTGLANWPDWDRRLPYFLIVSTARPKKTDAGILSFRITPLPGTPAKKPEFAIRAGIAATAPTRLTAELLRNGVSIAAAELRFNQAGEKIFSARDFPPVNNGAPVRYAIHLQSDDLWAEDNSASGYAPQIGPPRILLVSRRAGRKSLSVKAAGAKPAFNSATGITRILPQAFPDSVAKLAEYQVILLDNIARGDLPARGGRAIMQYVTKTGGGLLIVGGTRAFGPGGYALPTNAGAMWPIERLSPLASAPPRRSARHVVFLLDSSGSMGQRVPGQGGETRFNLAAGGVEAAIHLLKPKDSISIITFSGAAHLLASGQQHAIDSVFPERLAQVQPNGPTNPDAVLPLLGRLLKKNSLLILLTDGHIPVIATRKWVNLIRKQHATFLVVAGYKHESNAFISLLRQTGAHATATRKPTDWAWLIKQAVGKYLAGKAQNSSMLWRETATAVTGTTIHWIRTWLKRGATQTATGHNLAFPGRTGVPLAAEWRRGLGKVGAIAFSDHSIEFADFTDRMIHKLAAQPGDRRFSIRTRRFDGHWRISVSGRSGKAFINHARIRLRLISDTTGDTGESPSYADSYSFIQTAPGEYKLALPSHIRMLDAVVFIAGKSAGTAKSARKGRTTEIIGRIAPATLPPACLPATGHWRPCPWTQPFKLPLNTPAAGKKWQPWLKKAAWPCAKILLIGAVGLILLALYFART